MYAVGRAPLLSAFVTTFHRSAVVENDERPLVQKNTYVGRTIAGQRSSHVYPVYLSSQISLSLPHWTAPVQPRPALDTTTFCTQPHAAENDPLKSFRRAANCSYCCRGAPPSSADETTESMSMAPATVMPAAEEELAAAPTKPAPPFAPPAPDIFPVPDVRSMSFAAAGTAGVEAVFFTHTGLFRRSRQSSANFAIASWKQLRRGSSTCSYRRKQK